MPPIISYIAHFRFDFYELKLRQTADREAKHGSNFVRHRSQVAATWQFHMRELHDAHAHAAMHVRVVVVCNFDLSSAPGSRSQARDDGRSMISACSSNGVSSFCAARLLLQLLLYRWSDRVLQWVKTASTYSAAANSSRC